MTHWFCMFLLPQQTTKGWHFRQADALQMKTFQREPQNHLYWHKPAQHLPWAQTWENTALCWGGGRDDVTERCQVHAGLPTFPQPAYQGPGIAY